ncbi:MAG: tripartite tricarboxylate transporter substrate binding protein [Burkholderiaceae bacterium]
MQEEITLTRTLSAAGAIVAACAALCTGPVAAQQYPTRPVTVVVPFPAGGGGDFLARTVQDGFSKALGQQVIIENKAGAGGALGTSAVARAAPDGYTIVLGNIGTHAINPSVYKTLSYDPVKDFAPISHAVNVEYGVIVGKKQNVASLKELIQVARQNPGKLNFGSGGAGSGPHLGGELFKKHADIDIAHIPYKGGAPMMNDLLGGQIDLVVADLPTVIAQVRAGSLRLLAMASKERSPLMPDVPTTVEAGLEGFEMSAWQALYAPAGTPAPIISRINAAFTKALSAPDVRERLRAAGSEVVASTPEALAAFQGRELQRWAKVAKDAKVELQ